jgi:acyl-coenzyme A thioesterase 13
MAVNFPADFGTDAGFDIAEDHIGPFYFSRSEPGLYAFKAGPQHCNAHGIVHGGVLMTFADYALCMAATDHYAGESCVTVSFACEFVAAAQLGHIVVGRVTVTRKTRSLVFTRGEILVDDAPVMTFSSIVKRLIDREAPAAADSKPQPA